MVLSGNSAFDFAFDALLEVLVAKTCEREIVRELYSVWRAAFQKASLFLAKKILQHYAGHCSLHDHERARERQDNEHECSEISFLKSCFGLVRVSVMNYSCFAI